MKLTALAVVILALGIVLGLALRDTVFEAEAAQPATVTIQTEVTLQAGFGGGLAGGSNDYSDQFPVSLFSIDTTKYPTGTAFTLEVNGLEESNNSHCLRLAEVTEETEAKPTPTLVDPVPGSEVCTQVSPSNEFVVLRSKPLTLSSGEGLYMAQSKQVTGSGLFDLGVVRVVAEWEEQTQGPSVAELPPSGGTPPQQSDSLPLPASIALGVLFIGAGGLYVVKVRRG